VLAIHRAAPFFLRAFSPRPRPVFPVFPSSAWCRHHIKVRLHIERDQASLSPIPSLELVSTAGGRGPAPPGTKFTIRPPRPAARCGAEDDGNGDGGDDSSGGVEVGRGTGSHGGEEFAVSSSFDASSAAWWACGRDLPTTPLVATRPLPCRGASPVVAGAEAAGGSAVPSLPSAGDVTAAAEAPGARAAGALEAAQGPGGEPVTAIPSPSSFATRTGAAEGEEGQGGGGSGGSRRENELAGGDGGGGGGGGGAGAGAGAGAVAGVENQRSPPIAEAASPPASAQGDRCRARRRRARATADRGRQRVFDLEVFISQLLLRGEAFPRQAPPPPIPMRKSSGCGSEPGVGPVPAPAVRAPPVLATDYHCVTAGLLDDGRRVRLEPLPPPTSHVIALLSEGGGIHVAIWYVFFLSSPKRCVVMWIQQMYPPTLWTSTAVFRRP